MSSQETDLNRLLSAKEETARLNEQLYNRTAREVAVIGELIGRCLNTRWDESQYRNNYRAAFTLMGYGIVNQNNVDWESYSALMKNGSIDGVDMLLIRGAKLAILSRREEEMYKSRGKAEKVRKQLAKVVFRRRKREEGVSLEPGDKADEPTKPVENEEKHQLHLVWESGEQLDVYLNDEPQPRWFISEQQYHQSRYTEQVWKESYDGGSRSTLRILHGNVTYFAINGRETKVLAARIAIEMINRWGRISCGD